jgi:NitT/TauT family transport system substrate-binding protein
MRLTCVGVRVPASRIVVAALTAALLSGCHVLGGSSAASGSVTVAVVPGIDNAPLNVAAQDGLFKQNGLNVTIKNYTSLTAEYQALSSGQAQVATGDYTGFLYQETTGAKLRLLADGYDATSNSVEVLTLPDSTITTPQELGGKSVATPSAQLVKYNAKIPVPFNYESLSAETVLQSDGVSPSSVTWQQMQPDQEIDALQNRTVQAILVTEPYILQAEEKLGAVEVLDASSGVTDQLPMSGYFSLESYAKANTSTVRAFQTALSQAQAECAQRGPVQSVLSTLTGMDLKAADLITLGTYPTSLNTGQVQRVAKLMYDSGMVRSRLSVSTLASG